jgi:hypothetical protein
LVHYPSSTNTRYCTRPAQRSVYHTLSSVVISARIIITVFVRLKAKLHSCALSVTTPRTRTITLPGLTPSSDTVVPGRRDQKTSLERAGHPVLGAFSSGIPDPSPGGAHGARYLTRAAIQRDTALMHPSHRDTAPCRTERYTTLVRARRLVWGVDDIRRRYCARIFTESGLARP